MIGFLVRQVKSIKVANLKGKRNPKQTKHNTIKIDVKIIYYY